MSSFFIVVALWHLLGLVISQVPQCYQEGQCSGVFVGTASTPTYNDCLDLCQDDEDCQWFTHMGDSNDCLHFLDCLEIEPVCNNCFSGEAGCAHRGPQCHIQGFCNGRLVEAVHTDSAEDCLIYCKETEGCGWYSYFPDTTYCVLTEDCQSVDDTCASCEAGEKGCGTGGVIGHKLFAVGGTGTSQPVLAEVIDLGGGGTDSGQSCSLRNISGSSESRGIGIFINNTAMACLGAECYTYDPVGDVWDQTETMLVTRNYAAAALTSPTQWWVAGGGNNLASSEVFTVGQGFSVGPQLPSGMSGAALVKVNATHTMLLHDSSAWMYSEESGEWTEMPSIQFGRCFFGHAGLVTHTNGRSAEVVVASGWLSGGKVAIFNLESREWRPAAVQDFPVGELSDGLSVPYGDTFLIAGGSVEDASNGTALRQTTIYMYQAETESFVELPQRLAVARTNFAAFLVPDDYVDCEGKRRK